MQPALVETEDSKDDLLRESSAIQPEMEEMDWSKMEADEITGATTAAATRIQAAFRGFSLRRRKPLTHLRKIWSMRQELSVLQAKAADPSYVDRICVDVMECRKLQEGIMTLLLQLDALQGVHPVVRDIRKSVNREVVQFMEVIDAVVIGAPSSPWQDTKHNPNISRSNSVSHVDRFANHCLKRMHSLDNCTNPGQAYKRQHDNGLNFEQCEASGGMLSHSGRAGESRCSSPPNCCQDGDSLMGNAGPEETGYQSLRAVTAAVIIQSWFRGYLVRRTRPMKHLRDIDDVRTRLRDVADHVSSPNFHPKLRADKMERLKVTEYITALLLQLDSVQGVDQVVRDIRKSVTREVVKLQELVDTLVNNLEIAEGSTSPIHGTGFESDLLTTDGSVIYNERSASDKWTEGQKSTEESVNLDSLSLYNTGHEREDDDEVKPSTPESYRPRNDMDVDDVSSDLSTEDNCPGEIDHVQVRFLDRSPANINLSSSLESEAERDSTILSDSSKSEGGGNRLSDQESGPCAAVDWRKGYSRGINGEGCGPLPALKSSRHFRSHKKEGSARETHLENVMSTPTLESRQWLDEFMDGEAGACLLSGNASSEDLQALAVAANRGTPIKNPFLVRDTYDRAHMEVFKESQNCSSPDQGNRVRNTAASLESDSRISNVEQTDSLSDGCAPALSTLTSTRNNDYVSDGNTSSGNPGDQPSHEEDKMYPSVRTVVDIDGVNTEANESSCGKFHAIDTKAALLRSEQQQQGVGSVDNVSQLTEENTRLRALLNQVLNFVEVQNSMVSAISGTNEHLEADNLRLKKREEVWRKKTKRVRRRG